MFRRPLALALASAALVGAAATPADALQFATSSTTGKGGTLYPLRMDGAQIGPLGLMAGIRVMPGLSDLLGNSNLRAGMSDGFTLGLDGDIGLAYRYTIADINFLGRFNPSIAPFLGYRGIWGLTNVNNLGGLEAIAGTSIVHGLNYGVRAETELPLGFSAFSQLGLTTLMGGSWDQRVNSISTNAQGTINVGGATLPSFGIGAAWSVGPAFRLAVGYDIFQLPTDFRAQTGTLGPGRSTINNLTVGVSLLGFSI